MGLFICFSIFFAISRRYLGDTLIRMMHPGLLRAATYVVVSLMRSSQMIVFFERHTVSARRFMYSVVTVCVRKRILRLNVTVFPLQRSFQALTRVLHTAIAIVQWKVDQPSTFTTVFALETKHIVLILRSSGHCLRTFALRSFYVRKNLRDTRSSS